MTAIATPTRTYEQRMTALARAQKIRLHRADVKRAVKAGRLDVIALFDDPLCDTMRVGEALIAQQGVGKTKRNRILLKAGISPNRSFGGLTDSQRNRLAGVIG